MRDPADLNEEYSQIGEHAKLFRLALQKWQTSSGEGVLSGEP
jgi:hypothetical protein